MQTYFVKEEKYKMKCMKKIKLNLSFESMIYPDVPMNQYEELLFNIRLYSLGKKTEKTKEKEEYNGFVIGMMKTKGNSMLFLDYAERLIRLFETPQINAMSIEYPGIK